MLLSVASKPQVTLVGVYEMRPQKDEWTSSASTLASFGMFAPSHQLLNCV